MQESRRKYGRRDLKVKPPKTLQHDFVKSNLAFYADVLMTHYALLSIEESLPDDLREHLFRRFLTQTLETDSFLLIET